MVMDKNQVYDCVKQLQKSIECSICLDDLQDPVQTRCGHSFCAKCLQTALSSKSGLPCPLCKFPIKKRSIRNSLPLSNVVNSVTAIKKAYNLLLSQEDPDCSPILSQRSVALSQRQDEPATLDLLDIAGDFDNEDPFAELGNVKRHNHEKVKLIENESQDIKKKKFESHDHVTKKDQNVNIRKCTPKNITSRLRKSASKPMKNKENKTSAKTQNQSAKTDKTNNVKQSKNPHTSCTNQASKQKPTNGKKLNHTNKNKELTKSSKTLQSSKNDTQDQFSSTRNSQSETKSASDDGLEPDINRPLASANPNQKVNDKVVSWLQHVAPTEPGDQEDSHQNVDEYDFEDSDFEDLVSASQQPAQHQSYHAIAKRRKLVNDEILKDLKQKNDKRDNEIFGAKTKQQQYQPKKGTIEKLRNAISPNAEETSKPLKIKKARKEKRLDQKKATKSKRNSNMFDVIGLSQGVSPFSSPAKENESQEEKPESRDNNMDSVETNISSNVVEEKIVRVESLDRELSESKSGPQTPKTRSQTVLKSSASEVPPSPRTPRNSRSVQASPKTPNNRVPASPQTPKTGSRTPKTCIQFSPQTPKTRSQAKSQLVEVSSCKETEKPARDVKKEIIDEDQDLNLTKTAEEIQEDNLSQSIVKKRKQKRNFGSPVTQDWTQDSKSTLILDEPKITTVTATVHSQPKSKSREQTEFKTPVPRKSLPSKLSSTSKSKYGLLRLEDMPIVCVGETQDDSEKQQPYIVETPAQSEASILPKLRNSKGANVENDISSVVNNKKSVELGLLDFSEPSQNREDGRSNGASNLQQDIVPAAALLQTTGSTSQYDFQPEINTKNISSPRRSRRFKKSIEASLLNDDEEIFLKQMETTKVSNVKERVQSNPKTPKKKHKELQSKAEENNVACTDISSAKNIGDSISSNVSSTETNIIENTEDVDRTRFIPNTRVVKNATSNEKSKSPKVLKLNEAREVETVDKSAAPITDSNVIGTSLPNESQSQNNLDIIPLSQTGSHTGTDSPDDIFNQNNMLENQPNPVHISATLPEAAKDKPKLNSVDSCGIVHTTDNIHVSKKQRLRKKSADPSEYYTPPENDCVDECSVASSPSFFSPSQPSFQEDKHINAETASELKVEAWEQIRLSCKCAARTSNPAQTEKKECDLSKCQQQLFEDKAVQVEELQPQSKISSKPSSKKLRSVSAQCSPLIGDALENISFHCGGLKAICQEVSKNSQLSIKIHELESYLLKSLENSTCSSESAIKTASKKRFRELSSSESEVASSPLKDMDQMLLHNEDSDIVDVEIENSLPDIRQKRNRKAKARARKLAQKRIQSPKASENSTSKGLIASPNQSFASAKKSESQKSSPEMPQTNESEELDIIQATSRSACRRKRVISSDEEEDMPESQPRKKSNVLLPPEKPDQDLYSDALFDAPQSFLENNITNVVDLTNDQPTQASQQSRRKAKKGSQRSRKDMKSIDESSPLTESQIPPPTPPPPVTGVKENSKVNDLLKSISELTKSTRQLATDNTNSQPHFDKDDPIEVIESPTSPKPLEREHQEPTTCDIDGGADEDDKLKDRTNDLNNQVASPSDDANPMCLTDNPTATPRKFGVMVSGLRGKAIGLVKLFSKKWGGEFFESFVAGKVTHAIVRTQDMRCDRTLKYLQAVASKAWVVSISWVTHSLKEKTLLPEDRFEVLGDNLELSEAFSYGPKRSRLCSFDFKLLSGFVVYCIPPFALFTEAQYVELLRICGARVVNRPEELSRFPGETKIITVDPDAYSDELPNYAELSSQYQAEAVSCSWALDCIATFNIQPTANFPVEDMDSEVL